MNREELLEACFDLTIDELPTPSQWFEYTELDPVENPNRPQVRSIVGLGKRRVIVRCSESPGAEVTVATTTIPVAAIMNVCTDPAHRGKGYATVELMHAHEVAATHSLTHWAALFAGADAAGFYERFGYYHPEGSPAEFLVCDLHDEKWPKGAVMLRERW